VRLFCTSRGERGGSEVVYELLEYAYKLDHGSALPAIKKTPNGKPYFPDRLDVHFSLSHCRTHVLCALSEHPVGVDIESPRQISQRALKFFSTEEELALFDPLDLWVLKESYIKLYGGILVNVRTIRFSRTGKHIIAPDDSAVSMLYRIGDCHAAVSCMGEILLDCVEML